MFKNKSKFPTQIWHHLRVIVRFSRPFEKNWHSLPGKQELMWVSIVNFDFEESHQGPDIWVRDLERQSQLCKQHLRASSDITLFCEFPLFLSSRPHKRPISWDEIKFRLRYEGTNVTRTFFQTITSSCYWETCATLHLMHFLSARKWGVKQPECVRLPSDKHELKLSCRNKSIKHNSNIIITRKVKRLNL